MLHARAMAETIGARQPVGRLESAVLPAAGSHGWRGSRGRRARAGRRRSARPSSDHDDERCAQGERDRGDEQSGQPGVDDDAAAGRSNVCTATSADSSATVTSAAVRATRGWASQCSGTRCPASLRAKHTALATTSATQVTAGLMRRPPRSRWGRRRGREQSRRGSRRSPRAARGSRRARTGWRERDEHGARPRRAARDGRSGPVTRGQTRPRNAAAAAASRPYVRGSPSASPSSAPEQRERVPQDEHADAGPPEPEPRRPPRLLRGGDGRRLVDRQLRRARAVASRGRPSRGATCGPYSPLRTPSSPAVAMAAPAQATGADDADERELRAAREHQEAERHRLRHRQARRDGERAERDAVQAGGQRDGDRLADRRPGVVAGRARAQRQIAT